MRLSAWPLDSEVRNCYNVAENKKGLKFFPFNSYLFFFFFCLKKLYFNLVQDLGGAPGWSCLRSSGGGPEAGRDTADQGAN